MKGKAIIISAPSGAGKTTIVNHLLESGLSLEFSVSATTRLPRGTEKNGADYYFLSVPEFRMKIETNSFVEWEEVYTDLLYGTLKSEVERIWNNGNHLLFDVDVKGGISLKKIFGEDALSIFVEPPSINELEKRLVKRGTDSAEKIRMRVEKASEEMKLANMFDRILVNDNIETAKAEAIKIVSTFLYDNKL